MFLFLKKAGKMRLVTVILLLAVLLAPSYALAAPDDELFLGSVRVGENGVLMPMPPGGNTITLADNIPVGSTPIIYLHFNLNVTNQPYFQENFGKIHLRDATGEMLVDYHTSQGYNGVLGISPSTPLSEGTYTIIVDAGVKAGGSGEPRVSTQSYTIIFTVGNIDNPPPDDEDTTTVMFNVSGVSGTPYAVTVQNTGTSKFYSTDSARGGALELPDGNYYYAVSASGFTTVQGYFTVNNQGLLSIPVTLSNSVRVTFVTTPSAATMTLKIGQNTFIDPVPGETKVFNVQPGLEYTYVVMHDGYIVGSSRFTPIADMTMNVTLVPGEDGQGNGGNTLTLLSPSDITLGKLANNHYYNIINQGLDGSKAIVFGFTMGAGVNNLNETSFINERLPLIEIYDKYPGGNLVAKLKYIGFDWATQTISIGLDAGTLAPGTYCLVFGRDVCGNNPNKTLGCDIVFEFTVTDSNVPAIIPGDVNGDGVVDIFDVRRILDHISGINPLTGNALIAADMNGDGEIDIFDVRRILDRISGIN